MVVGWLLHAAAVVAQDFTFFTQMLRVLLALVRHIQAIRLLQRALFMWVDVNMALDTLLSHIGPGVPTHPLPLTLRTLVLPETPLLSLIRRQSLAFGSGLRAVFDIMSLVEAEVA